MGVMAKKSEISAVYYGGNEVSEIYKGERLVYQNRPKKWLHVTPVLATLSKATWNATTEYGDCTGNKEFYRGQTGYRVIRQTGSMAGSDAAWYDGDFSSTLYDVSRIYQSNMNLLIHAGPGIDFPSPREVYGVCIKLSGAGNDVSQLALAVRYANGISEIVKTSNSSFSRNIVKKMVYYFDEPALVSSIIMTRWSTVLTAVSRCGVYILVKEGDIDYADIPGDEID